MACATGSEDSCAVKVSEVKNAINNIRVFRSTDAPPRKLRRKHWEVTIPLLELSRESRGWSGRAGLSLGFAFGAVAHGDEEDGAFAFGVAREEAGDVVVEESEAGGAESLRVGREIKLSPEDARFELHGAIAAVAEALQNGTQVGEEKDGHSGVGGQLLLQAEVTGIGAKVSLLQAFEQTTVAMKDVGSGREPFDGVDNQVEIIELSSRGIKEIGGHAAGGAVQHGRKLWQRNRAAGKFSRGTAALDDLFDGVARHFGICQRLELNNWSAGRRKVCNRSLTAPRFHFLGRIERRGGVHFSHERIIHFALGERDGFEAKLGNFRRRWRQGSRDVAEGHQGEGHFTLGIDIQQAIDARVQEAANNLCRETQRRGDSKQIGE